MFYPIFFPMHSETPKCPHCHADEDTMVVCKKCGHEYEEEGPPLVFNLVAILVVLVAIYALFTIGYWLLENSSGNIRSLVDVMKSQAEYIGGLKLW